MRDGGNESGEVEKGREKKIERTRWEEKKGGREIKKRARQRRNSGREKS